MYQETYISIKNMFHSSYNLFMSIIISSICILFTGSVIRFIIPAISVSLGKSEIFTSYFFSIMAAGTIFGGIFYSKLTTNSTPNKLMIFWFLYGLLLLTMSILSVFSTDLLLLLSLPLGIVGAFVDITLVTVIQIYSKKEGIGKNFGIFSTLANTSEAISGILSGIFAFIGIIFSFITMSLLIILTSFLGLFLILRNSDELSKLKDKNDKLNENP